MREGNFRWLDLVARRFAVEPVFQNGGVLLIHGSSSPLGSYQEPSLQSMSLCWDLTGFQRSIIAYFIIYAISASFRGGDFLTVQEVRERQRGKRALA
jgi:hypothetical protein